MGDHTTINGKARIQRFPVPFLTVPILILFSPTVLGLISGPGKASGPVATQQNKKNNVAETQAAKPRPKMNPGLLEMVYNLNPYAPIMHCLNR